MLTTSLATLVRKKFPDWSAENVREIINEVQNMMLMSKPLRFMRLKGSDGLDPVLTTISGTYTYAINTTNGFSSDAWYVHSVYETSASEPEDGVTIVQGTSSSAATVTFDSDPSGDYYVWCYRKPTQITALSVALSVPPQYHMSTFFDGVVGFIEKMDSGVSQTWEKFEQNELPRFWYDMNKDNAWVLNSEYLGGY